MAVPVTRHLLTLVKEEKVLLRTELQVLKECQIKFLTGAVVSAGIILGLPGVSQRGSDLSPGAYLVPLVILLPSWWGFFDKAKTITRIVGYFRILERIAVVPVSAVSNDIARFLAWENSVSEYRQWERNGRFNTINYGAKPGVLEITKAVFLVPSQRYWSLANYTYATLSALCLIITFARFWDTSKNMYSLTALLMLSAAFAFGYTLIWNTSIWWELMWGRHSYRATEAYWRHILTSER